MGAVKTDHKARVVLVHVVIAVGTPFFERSAATLVPCSAAVGGVSRLVEPLHELRVVLVHAFVLPLHPLHPVVGLAYDVIGVCNRTSA